MRVAGFSETSRWLALAFVTRHFPLVRNIVVSCAIAATHFASRLLRKVATISLGPLCRELFKQKRVVGRRLYGSSKCVVRFVAIDGETAVKDTAPFQENSGPASQSPANIFPSLDVKLKSSLF